MAYKTDTYRNCWQAQIMKSPTRQLLFYYATVGKDVMMSHQIGQDVTYDMAVVKNVMMRQHCRQSCDYVTPLKTKM